jgi:hypothetical protein
MLALKEKSHLFTHLSFCYKLGGVQDDVMQLPLIGSIKYPL